MMPSTKTKRKRPKGSTSVDLTAGTRQDLRLIMKRTGTGRSGTRVPITRAVAAIIRKFGRIQDLADERGFLRIKAANGLDPDNNLTLDLNIE